jgi:subtilase family serine protease
VNATKSVSFSSIGPSFDKRIKPEVVAQGVASVLSDERKYCQANGTSFSSPILAGMVALFMAGSS